MTLPNYFPRSNHPLDAEERGLLDVMESGELRSVATPELLDQLRQAAYATGQSVLHRYAIGEFKDGQRA